MNKTQTTTYDKLMRAWENSKELVRDFQTYSNEMDDHELKQVFKQFAEDEGMHATKLREIISSYQDK
ncbi:rubrerythrin [Sporanaerobium hydrogeniformans]|uniref:Rubrerythrin n=1 Tax=Sporanaerobium hydrogeniformans TaxID=3072179 RepID=A0AC61DHS2_9FIRM|nr:rubrerythrin [Sporanaerobium hydrogeniformans]PHV72327.1 rubrerythrin [Sporanaerobium hydrogeniformans]